MTNPMQKKERHQILKEIINDKDVYTQTELSEELKKRSIMVTQSSLSRDIDELGIVKIKGVYRIPNTHIGTAIMPVMSMKWAGETLLVLHTYPSMAPQVGGTVDAQNLKGVVGTIAGDDTVFVAVERAEKKKVEKEIRNIWK